jgi:copper resistance protein D
MIDPLILLRGVHLGATALATGTAGFTVLVGEPAFRGSTGIVPAEFAALRRRWNALIVIALAFAIVSGAGWLVLLAANIYGVSVVEVCRDGGVWSVAAETRFGLVWEIRLALALAVALLLVTRWRPALLLAAAALIGSLAVVGHAGAAPGAAGIVHLAADTLHLIAAGAWVGGLPALALLMDRARRAASPAWRALAAAAARRFSPLGIVAVATVATTGLINCWYMLGGPRDLFTTDYGRLVLLKIGLFAAMAGIAAVNRFHLTPRLELAGAVRALERNSFAETGLGLCVLFVVGALGTLSPSAHDHMHVAGAPIEADAAFVHVHSQRGMADVSISPARCRLASIQIRLMREDVSLLPAKDVGVVLTPQEPAAAPSISRRASRLPDARWKVAGLEIGQVGVWIVKLTIKTGIGEPFVFDAPFVIDR